MSGLLRPPRRLRAMRVLVVCVDELWGAAVQEVLHRRGLEATAVRRGDVTFWRRLAGEVDVVLVDVEGDAGRVEDELRRILASRRRPVGCVLVSDDPPARPAALSKWSSPDELVAALEAAYPRP